MMHSMQKFMDNIVLVCLNQTNNDFYVSQSNVMRIGIMYILNIFIKKDVNTSHTHVTCIKRLYISLCIHIQERIQGEEGDILP